MVFGEGHWGEGGAVILFLCRAWVWVWVWVGERGVLVATIDRSSGIDGRVMRTDVCWLFGVGLLGRLGGRGVLG